jgi:hypothetical protein
VSSLSADFALSCFLLTLHPLFRAVSAPTPKSARRPISRCRTRYLLARPVPTRVAVTPVCPLSPGSPTLSHELTPNLLAGVCDGGTCSALSPGSDLAGECSADQDCLGCEVPLGFKWRALADAFPPDFLGTDNERTSSAYCQDQLDSNLGRCRTWEIVPTDNNCSGENMTVLLWQQLR